LDWRLVRLISDSSGIGGCAPLHSLSLLRQIKSAKKGDPTMEIYTYLGILPKINKIMVFMVISFDSHYSQLERIARGDAPFGRGLARS
jgi:hypothetical protein